jgi:hypothetical protein
VKTMHLYFGKSFQHHFLPQERPNSTTYSLCHFQDCTVNSHCLQMHHQQLQIHLEKINPHSTTCKYFPITLSKTN